MTGAATEVDNEAEPGSHDVKSEIRNPKSAGRAIRKRGSAEVEAACTLRELGRDRSLDAGFGGIAELEAGAVRRGYSEHYCQQTAPLTTPQFVSQVSLKKLRR